MKYIKLSKYAKENGISYITALRHFKKGLLDNVKILKTGTILVGIEEKIITSTNTVVAIYSRVSSSENKNNLNSQQNRLVEYATSKGYTIKYLVKEISSGMNDNRPKLLELLKKDDFNILLVEHKDRLTRFGFNYIETFLKKENKVIEVVNKTVTDNENLIEDLISIIYSFSARLYGKRRSKSKAKNVIKEVMELNQSEIS